MTIRYNKICFLPYCFSSNSVSGLVLLRFDRFKETDSLLDYGIEIGFVLDELLLAVAGFGFSSHGCLPSELD